MKDYSVVVLPGDGIGPEIVNAAVEVLQKVAEQEGFVLNLQTYPVGGASYDAEGSPLTDQTLAACKAADAVLLGAVGGPKWDHIEGADRPEMALLKLRSELGLYANLRPAVLHQPLAAASPLHPDTVAEGIDILFVRELTGGIYFGERGRVGIGTPDEAAFDTERYSKKEVQRIAEIAFDAAKIRKGKVTSIDKANVLESSRLWRETVKEVAADHSDVELDHLYVDNAAMQLVKRPSTFDVIVTTNMFGDILSDEAAMITGSIGMLPSASLGDPGKPGMFEPIHGSAPDIAGTGKANPLATILSAAMLLRYSLHEESAAAKIELAVANVLADGWRCADLVLPGQDIEHEKILNCKEMTDRVLAEL